MQQREEGEESDRGWHCIKDRSIMKLGYGTDETSWWGKLCTILFNRPRWQQTLEWLEHTCMKWEINSYDVMCRSKRTVLPLNDRRSFIYWVFQRVVMQNLMASNKKSIRSRWETRFKTFSYTSSLQNYFLFFLQLHIKQAGHQTWIKAVPMFVCTVQTD